MVENLEELIMLKAYQMIRIRFAGANLFVWNCDWGYSIGYNVKTID